MGGALGVAPKMAELYGYDVLILKNRVEFLMEKCQHRCLDYSETLLFKKLRKLHHIKLIHGDIKNSNIGWSKERS